VFNVKILQAIFSSKYKINTDVAVSGENALLKCQQRISQGLDAYKFIVMDINMPGGMDGVQTTSKIRKIFDPYTESRGQQYFVVAHTALPEDQFGDYKEKGFDGFMQKPLI
jgi:CheY-like chemotaxis protein